MLRSSLILFFSNSFVIIKELTVHLRLVNNMEFIEQHYLFLEMFFSFPVSYTKRVLRTLGLGEIPSRWTKV